MRHSRGQFEARRRDARETGSRTDAGRSGAAVDSRRRGGKGGGKQTLGR